MKKTVITCMLLQKMHSALYSALQPEIHVNSNYAEAIYFPINALMANQLQKNDELTVIILKFNDDMNPTSENNFQANYQIFQNEMNKINETIGAKIEYKIIETDFVETNDVFAERFLNIFNILEQDCTIYTDITFGPKTATLLIMNLLSFAENFYDADIEAIIYGKTSFIATGDQTETTAKGGKVLDVSSLYFLNNLTDAIHAQSPQDAIQVLKELFLQ
ncbi:MAG: hypothetical protein J6R96_09220 [Spirochaetaceae bacterium]|nr:hypothetical protein [Spirochaetaceae bacterium]